MVAGAASAAPCTETAKTADSIKCVEDHWQAAFIGGDDAYLSQLLSDGYQSYSATGDGHDRAAIIGFAKDYAKAHPHDKPAPPPMAPDVQIRGDVAVVFWRDKGKLTSVDSFYWSDNRWHAWYSQHASTSK
nr:hypothetical protein [Kofleriaceae bacterium]